MSTELTFKLVGSDEDRGHVQFEEFVKFCSTINKCLRASESIISGETGKIDYRITDLKCDSATIKLRPIRKGPATDNQLKVVSFFRKTVADLQSGKIDPRIPPSDLQTFRELSEPLKRHAKRVVIGRVSITTTFDETIGKLLDENTSSEGSVTGMLERLNVHDRNEFIVYPPIIGGQVTCSFPERLLDKVRQAVKKNVTVTGTQFYRPGSAVPSRVHVQDMEIHPADSELPSLYDLRALGKWDTGGLTAVDFVRAIRDE